ncbi:PREDICTED: uncharacterized protein LOC109154381 [Ipomoea nil]|uniref:uncharacterized protein LOC109154381 n=1 Tax=Ipomoea nil TaxID=35883 RepID=UPI0009012197|nr:PREDICTED: uncharacterized protein LOC109154381 [Ipomoea nil]
MIRDYERKAKIHGFTVARTAPSISHYSLPMIYSFIFFKALVEEASHLQQILKEYERASGQCINLTKSSLAFSKNTCVSVRNHLSNILGIHYSGNNGNYLGLPMIIGRNKTEILNFIKHRIVSRIQGWNHRFISKAGREILLKFVIQALPAYAMGVFLLPKGLINAVETTMNSYWWKGGGNNNKGIIWKNWKSLCIRKKWGGIGFWDLHGFNLALLSKQAWRLTSDPDSLVSKIYKARYYPNSSFLEANLGANPSFIWSSLMATQDITLKMENWQWFSHSYLG